MLIASKEYQVLAQVQYQQMKLRLIDESAYIWYVPVVEVADVVQQQMHADPDD